MDTPEHCRVSQPHYRGPPIPFQLHIPPGYNLPHQAQYNDDPFQAQPVQTVQQGGHILHLTQSIAAQVRGLAPMAERPRWGHRPIAAVSFLLSMNTIL